MSNYYKENVRLSSFAKIITNVTVNNLFTNLGIPLNSGYTTDVTVLANERPNAIKYTYNNVDISTWCIAPWVESVGSTAFTSIPAWCNKIRAILIGGGGGGVRGQNSTLHQDVTYLLKDHTHYMVQNFHHHRQEHLGFPSFRDFDYHLDHAYPVHQDGGNVYQWQQKQHTHTNPNAADTATAVNKGGPGGGGGGFVYISMVDIASNRANVSVITGTGGAAASQNSTAPNGISTNLTISPSTTYQAYGGSGGTRTWGGSGGGGSATGFINISGASAGKPSVSTASAGTSGGLNGSGTYITNSTIKNTYGKGGTGTAGSSYSTYVNSNGVLGGSNPTTSTADAGGSGYYRIYFLTN